MTPEQSTKKYVFKRFDYLMAWLSLALGYSFCRVLPVAEKRLGAMIFLAILWGLHLAWTFAVGLRPRSSALLFAAVAIAFLPSLLWTSDTTAVRWMYFGELVSFMLYLGMAGGATSSRRFGDYFFFDALRAVFISPFCSLDAHIHALLPNRGGKTWKRALLTALWILVGLCLAIVPTLLIIALLSYDEGFSNLIDKVLQLDAEEFWKQFFSVFFGVLLAIYAFSAFVTARVRGGDTENNEAHAARLREGIRVFPPALVYAALTPILAVYVLFFVSQKDAYLSAFTGVLPDGFTYSEYAVDGFENLCVVAAINAILLAVICLFVKQKGKTEKILLKCFSVLTSVFTLVLIATAIAKLVLYIGAYGLTVTRLHAAWFMALLTIGFLLVIVKQFWGGFRWMATMLVCFALLFGALCYGNPNAMVANYNVDAFLDGRLESVDTGELWKMGDAGIPALVRLYEEADVTTPEGYDAMVRARRVIEEYNLSNADRETGFFTFHVPRTRAERLLREKGYDLFGFEEVPMK